jgi:hypothetical protein
MVTILSSDSAPLRCHDLLKYRCDYFEHVQRRTVCIRSLNRLTWYLLLVVPRGWGHSFLPLWWGRPGVVWLEENTLPVLVSALSATFSHLFIGMPAALIVGGMRFLSVQQLAVVACRYRCCIALFRECLVQVDCPHTRSSGVVPCS